MYMMLVSTSSTSTAYEGKSEYIQKHSKEEYIWNNWKTFKEKIIINLYTLKLYIYIYIYMCVITYVVLEL